MLKEESIPRANVFECSKLKEKGQEISPIKLEAQSLSYMPDLRKCRSPQQSLKLRPKVTGDPEDIVLDDVNNILDDSSEDDQRNQVNILKSNNFFSNLAMSFEPRNLPSHTRNKSYARSGYSSLNLKQCRFCFVDEETLENPLIAPCKCSGSMHFIHVQCLRKWLARNQNVSSSLSLTTYSWRTFHCELCKTRFKQKI